MSEDRSVYLAIKRLIDNLCMDRVDFLVFVLDLSPHDVQSWIDGTSLPPDTAMLNIVKLVRYLGWHELPETHPHSQALANFWEVVEKCDRDPTLTEFRPPKNKFGDEQSIEDYFDQWPDMYFESNLGRRLLSAVPAHCRFGYLQEILGIVERHTPDEPT